jgi:hypothetical protein
VAIVLASKPGLTGATALSIPKDWDPAWFRGFISNMLKGADVRNAIGANGITVTGTIASPYATISNGGSPTFTSIVVGTPTGGNEGPGTINVSGGFYVNGVLLGAGAPALPFNSVQFNNAGAFGGSANFTYSAAGNVAIAAPSSGTALAVAGQTILAETGAQFTAHSTGVRLIISRYGSGTSPTALASGYYLGIGNTEYSTTTGYQLIGFGYAPNAQYPAFIGYQMTTNAAFTQGDLVFGTRVGTTDIAATEQMRIVSGPGTVKVAGSLQRTNTGGVGSGGWLDGNYSAVEAVGTAGCIYSIGGGSYYPNNNGTTALGTMYGIGYSYNPTNGNGTTMASTTGGGANTWGMYVATAGAAGAFIGGNGVAFFASTVTAPTFNSTSDRNKKYNIVRVSGASDIIESINGVRFNWKKDGAPSIGIIAQDVEVMLPELVDTQEETGVKTVNYNGIVGVLVEALKEQRARIDRLEAA